MVATDAPEETLKRIVAVAQELSEARYVAVHMAVETSAISPFFAKAGSDVEVVMGDEPPAWCGTLAARLQGLQVVRLGNFGSPPSQLADREALDGECLGVALPSARGVLGHLFVVSETYSACHVKRIEALAGYAGAALHTSLAQADMQVQMDLLHTVSHQTSLELKHLRPLLREAQQRLENLVQHLPEGVIMLDASFRVVMANPLGEDYLAVLSGVGVGVGDRLAVLGVYPIELLLLAPEDGHYHEIESQETSPRAFEVEVHALQSEAEASGWLLVLHEVTEKRQVRQQLQQKEHLANMGKVWLVWRMILITC